MIVYKVTDTNKETRGGMQWELGKKNTESGQGPFPGGGWLHAYASPEMAAIFHPAHVSFEMPRLFRAEAGGAQADDGGVKLGFSEMTLQNEIEMPEVSNWHRVRFALLLALETEKDSVFRGWANNVLGYGGPKDGLRPKFTAAQGTPIWRACQAYRDALDYTWHISLANMILEHARHICEYNPQHRLDLQEIARKAMETGNRIEEGPYTAANGVRFEVVEGGVYSINGYADLAELAYALEENPCGADEKLAALRAAFGYTISAANWIGSESWRLFRYGQDITGDLLEAVAVRYQKSVDEAMAKICPMPTEPAEPEMPICVTVRDGKIESVDGFTCLGAVAKQERAGMLDYPGLKAEVRVAVVAAFDYPDGMFTNVGSEPGQLFDPNRPATAEYCVEVAARYRASIQRFRATYQPKHQVLVDGTHQF